jgi:hypothetical protein
LGVKPVIELVNAPIPVPSFVQLSAVVGLGEVLQHTPAVTVAPPSDVTLPPELAVELVMPKINEVVTVGDWTFIAKLAVTEQSDIIGPVV